MQQNDWKHSLVKSWYSQEDVKAVPPHIEDELIDVSFAFTDAEWKETLKHFDYKCAYCKIQPVQTFDHVVPVDRGGLTSIDNLVPSCRFCNKRKRNLLPSEMQFPKKEIIEDILIYLRSRTKKTAPLEKYYATFPRETTRLEKQELYRNIDEINVRLEKLREYDLDKADEIQVINLGVSYSVRKVIIGVPEQQANIFSHCTFECENKAWQIYQFGASKEYAEDYLALLRMYCVMKSVFIDWKKLD